MVQCSLPYQCMQPSFSFLLKRHLYLSMSIPDMSGILTSILSFPHVVLPKMEIPSHSLIPFRNRYCSTIAVVIASFSTSTLSVRSMDYRLTRQCHSTHQEIRIGIYDLSNLLVVEHPHTILHSSPSSVAALRNSLRCSGVDLVPPNLKAQI